MYLYDTSISLCLTPAIQTCQIFYNLSMFSNESKLFGGIHSIKQTCGSTIDLVLFFKGVFINSHPLAFFLFYWYIHHWDNNINLN